MFFLVIYTGTMSHLSVGPHGDMLTYMAEAAKLQNALCVIEL